MNAVVADVEENSLAEELGLKKGDKIISINGQEMQDLIDFQFAWSDEYIELLIENTEKERIIFEIEKDYNTPLGVVFESAVFDKMHLCHNNCVFCFVAQMAPEMRDSLYQKDDDYRLSFLHGNFITLTNIKDEEMERIKKYNLSPLYISVHTTDPELRKKMLKNKNAGKIYDQLEELVDAGIKINTQIVLCPGMNDAEYLDKSLDDLFRLSKGINSVAIVPVGITKFRKDKDLFPEISRDYSEKLISKIEILQKKYKKEIGKYFVHLSDEFYVKAERSIPLAKFYDDFPQTENGIGISRIFIDDFEKYIDDFRDKIVDKKIYLACGESGAFVLKELLKQINPARSKKIELLVVKNDFFGRRVTVSGLVVARDLQKSIDETADNSIIIVPDIMLKDDEDVFLDGWTLERLKNSCPNKDIRKIETKALALFKEIS